MYYLEGRDERMEPREFITGFGTGPDWETFQRVWKRVMPDEKHSLIQVAEQPKKQNGTGHTTQEREPEAVNLEELLRQLCAGVNRVERLAGRTGMLPIWTLLYRQRSQNLKQLSTLYFLQTGKRYACPRIHNTERMEMDRMLRREYLWEERWGQYCAGWGEQITGKEVQRVSRELCQQAAQRQQKIRQALESFGK